MLLDATEVGPTSLDAFNLEVTVSIFVDENLGVSCEISGLQELARVCPVYKQLDGDGSARVVVGKVKSGC